MKTFICRLSGEDRDAIPDSPREVSVCCLVQRESPDAIEEPLRDVLQRLRAAPSGSLDGVRQLYLDDIIELSSKPGSAVLWVTSTGPGKAPGSVIQLHLPLPIDDSDDMTAYGHGQDPDEHPGQDIDSEPFIVFDAPPPTRSRAQRKSGSSSKPPRRKASSKPPKRKPK